VLGFAALQVPPLSDVLRRTTTRARSLRRAARNASCTKARLRGEALLFASRAASARRKLTKKVSSKSFYSCCHCFLWLFRLATRNLNPCFACACVETETSSMLRLLACHLAAVATALAAEQYPADAVAPLKLLSLEQYPSARCTYPLLRL
jgi:hypothetical protein